MSKMVYIRTDKNGTKIYHDYTCPRCGGAGGADKWQYTGWKCYECSGTGERINKPQVVKEYTPEYRAKLDAQAKKRAEKRRQKQISEYAANLPTLIQRKGFNEEGKIFLVIGDTYPIREELRGAGAKWCGELQGWIFTQPTEEYTTVEFTAEECLNFNPEGGTIWWKGYGELKPVIEGKLPKEDKLVSEYVGTVGEKLDIEVTFSKMFSYERQAFRGWGTEWVGIFKFVDDNGNILIWNTTASPEVEVGKRYQLTGTIAEHKEYGEDKQTILKRCKVKAVSN